MIEAIARRPQANDGLSILWVTPLRALAADLIVQVEAPLHALGIPWRVLRRTGDSGSSERSKLKAGQVEVLVTTPESLALQLSYEEARSRFATLGSIVVDGTFIPERLCATAGLAIASPPSGSGQNGVCYPHSVR
jgi:ATP-dependent helicase Lhr and Lhr-like helicase